MNTVDYIYKDIQSIMKNIVVKYDRLAKDNETLESRRASDRYISAVLETDTFNSHSSFSKDAIRNCDIFDENLVELYHADKKLIPIHLRERVLKEERFIIKETYEEMNDYYRELIGLPNKDDTAMVFLPLDVCEEYGLDSATPIHKYRDDEIYKIERTVLPLIIEQNPDKGYLKYLGTHRVDLIKARRALNFEIVYAELEYNPVFLQYFFSTYATCREYFTSVIYVKEFSSKYDLYDNFIAMNIMIMCVQRMMVNTIKIGVDRDFYDIPSIKALFDSYGLPFFEDLPLDYQRSIMKNLNMLLRYKSTDKVLYDLSSILFFDRIKIFKYFLIKERQFDENDNPLFVYKEEVDENGEITFVEDIEKMYNFYFQSTDILERNTALALENSHNKLTYSEVTESDMFWWDDEDVRQTLYDQEFNYVETKYLSVNVMYKLTETMFESIYALNMLADKKKSSTEDVYISLPKITLEKVSVFDAVILLCALTCKKNAVKGEIINKPAQILSVLGFNFKANFNKIRDMVLNNPRKYPQEISQYIVNMNLLSPNDINDMYSNISNLADSLTEMINTTNDLDVYRACKELYETMMIKDYTTDILQKKDGSVAKTYLEYLHDQQPRLGEFVDNCSRERSTIYIKHILGKLNEMIPEMQHMGTVEGSDNVLIRALLKLIEFFKSYTVDLNSLNVLYVMDSKYYNMIRMVHDINHMSKLMDYNEKSFSNYFDTVATQVKLSRASMLKFFSRCFVSKIALYKYLEEIIDTEYINKTSGLQSCIPKLTDKDRVAIDKIIQDLDKTNLREYQKYDICINEKDSYTLSELITELTKAILIPESSLMICYSDGVQDMVTHSEYDISLSVDDFAAFFSKLYINEYLSFEDKHSLITLMDVKDRLDVDCDSVNVDKNLNDGDSVKYIDYVKSYYSMGVNDTSIVGKIKDIVNRINIIGYHNSKIMNVNIVNILGDIFNAIDIKPKEWVEIHNIFRKIDKGEIRDRDMLHTYIKERDITLDSYYETSEIACMLGIKYDITPIEILDIARTAYGDDIIKSIEKIYGGTSNYIFKDKIEKVKRFVDKSLSKIFISKTLGTKMKLSMTDIAKINRHVHRNDTIYMKNKLKNLSSNYIIDEQVKNTHSLRYAKCTISKNRAKIQEIYRCVLRHNFKSILCLEHAIKAEKDSLIKMLLLDVYNSELYLYKDSYLNDKEEICDSVFDTIIKHNFEEVSKIDCKISEYSSNTEFWNVIFESYHSMIHVMEKEIDKLSSNPNLQENIQPCVDTCVYTLLTEIENVIKSIDKFSLYHEKDLSMVSEIIFMLRNLHFEERNWIVDKIHSINILINIKLIMVLKSVMHDLDVIVDYNDIIDSLMFSNISMVSIVNKSLDLGIECGIVSLTKDFIDDLKIEVKEYYNLDSIFNHNESLNVLYSDILGMSKDLVLRDKTNIDDRIKVFYE